MVLLSGFAAVCAGYNVFRDLVISTVAHSDRILMIGCGNSTLSEDMYNDGYKVEIHLCSLGSPGSFLPEPISPLTVPQSS